MRNRTAIQVAALVAVAGREQPIRKGPLQDLLGVSDFVFGRAIAYARLHGLVELNGGTVTVTQKGREMLDSDQSAS